MKIGHLEYQEHKTKSGMRFIVIFLIGFFIGVLTCAIIAKIKKTEESSDAFFKTRTFYLIGKGGIIGVERRSYAEPSTLGNNSLDYADAYIEGAF